MKNYKNRNWLNRKYWEEKLSTAQIAELCHCSKTPIRYWLKKFNIPIRSCSEGIYLATSNHCELSDKARQWIDGELMGDGHLRLQSKYSANIGYSSKHLEYIRYVSDTLKSFGIGQAGKIRKMKCKKWGNHAYHYESLCYVELLPIRKRWYPNNKKIIPRDLKLTPLVLRQEMIGDGCLVHHKNCRPDIILATCGFPIKDVEWLVKELNKLGFKSRRQPVNNLIGISTYSTKQFLHYIGECPVQCYQYKWEY